MSEVPIHTRAQPVSATAAPDDEQVMLNAKASQPGSFDQVFARYRGPVWGFFGRRVSDPAKAEEPRRTSFQRCSPHCRATRRGSVRSYIFAIASNILQADRRKLRAMQFEPVEDVTGPDDDPDAAIWARRALSLPDPLQSRSR